MSDLKKRMAVWSAESLSALLDSDFIDVFVTATEDRTNLKDGEILIENKIKDGAPPESLDLCLKEAERRKIPLPVIAGELARRAANGKSFISHLVAPSSWKKYEINAAKAIQQWLQQDGIRPDKIDFDARRIGKVTNATRQVDLWLETFSPPHTVAVECKDYKSGLVSVEKIEAFNTKLADIAAKKGVYITKKGYQKSAIATAKHYNITLLTFDIADRNNPPSDLNEQQKSALVSSKNDMWRLSTNEASWYFGSD